MAEKVKVTVNMTQEDVDALKEIAEAQGITLTEALRRAVRTEKFIQDTMAEDANILVEDKKKKTVKQVVFR
jgi:Ribbon-helix-helix protein, copG family